jgi:hypothetical protein
MDIKKILLVIRSQAFWLNVLASMIATIILALFSLLGSVIYGLMAKETISVAYHTLINILFYKIQLPVIGILFICILVILILTKFDIRKIKFSYTLPIKFLNKKKISKKESDFEKSLHNTVLFNYRMCSAFPGVRSLEWINDSKTALNRLAIILKKPLSFTGKNKSGLEYTSHPIWVFRGYSAYSINEFKILNKRKSKFLLEIDEFIVDRIAIYHSSVYYKDFIYIETKPDKPTGLYYKNEEEITECIKEMSYCCEEYAIYKNHYIPREHYDDGATLIKGRTVELTNPILRRRYLSKYNFIIAAQYSPINNNEANKYVNDSLNGILVNTHNFNDLYNYIIQLPKSQY